MDAERGREIAERDQLWASLRALRPHIDRLGDGTFDDSALTRQMVLLLARVVAAELDFRARDAADAGPPAGA